MWLPLDSCLWSRRYLLRKPGIVPNVLVSFLSLLMVSSSSNMALSTIYMAKTLKFNFSSDLSSEYHTCISNCLSTSQHRYLIDISNSTSSKLNSISVFSHPTKAAVFLSSVNGNFYHPEVQAKKLEITLHPSTYLIIHIISSSSRNPVGSFKLIQNPTSSHHL